MQFDGVLPVKMGEMKTKKATVNFPVGSFPLFFYAVEIIYKRNVKVEYSACHINRQTE